MYLNYDGDPCCGYNGGWLTVTLDVFKSIFVFILFWGGID